MSNPIHQNNKEPNLTLIKEGLFSLEKAFNQQKVNYRVVGSLLIAALNGGPHRTIGDIDVIIDKKDFSRIAGKLQEEGYCINIRKILGITITEMVRPQKLNFTFLLQGQFLKDYFSYQPWKFLELRISNGYLEPTQYSLFDVDFIGIPSRSIYEGIKISSLNPKRTLDKIVLEKKFDNCLPNGERLENAIKVYCFGRQLPWLYLLFSHLYNIFGGLRVLLGKKYEVWD